MEKNKFKLNPNQRPMMLNFVTEIHVNDIFHRACRRDIREETIRITNISVKNGNLCVEGENLRATANGPLSPTGQINTIKNLTLKQFEGGVIVYSRRETDFVRIDPLPSI